MQSVDLVSRLRDLAQVAESIDYESALGQDIALMREAADEIERLLKADAAACAMIQDLGDELTEVRAGRERLRALLSEAIEDIAAWGAYASEYFQDKHDLQGCLAQYRAALDVCTCKPLAQQTHAQFGTVRVTVDATCPLHGDVGGDRG